MMYTKVVNIYIKVKFDYREYRGNGIILLEHGGRQKEIYIHTTEKTCNRAIILVAKKAIESLKESCEVNLNLQTNIGFKFLENNKRWINRDLGSKLVEIINKGNHIVNFIDCSTSEEGLFLQKTLESKLIRYEGQQIIL
jgi:hypothetical protein